MTTQERRCPHCGQLIPSDSRFCEWCGKPISPQGALRKPQQHQHPAPPPPPPPTQAAPGPSSSAPKGRPTLLIALVAGGALLICLLVAGGGALFLWRGRDTEPASPAAVAPTLVADAPAAPTPTAAPEPMEPAPPEPTDAPGTVVEAFLKATLGSVPGASIDYDRARSLMTTPYAAQFDSPAFIPAAYGIQDGPTACDVSSEEIAGTTATVAVVGYWGGEPGRRWSFVLNHEAGSWKVAAINSLPISGSNGASATETGSTEPLLGQWQTEEGEGSDLSNRFRILEEPDGRLRVRWVDENSDIEGIEDLERFYLEIEPEGERRWVGDAITVYWDTDTGELIEEGRERVVLILSDNNQQLLIGPPDSEGVVAHRVADP